MITDREHHYNSKYVSYLKVAFLISLECFKLKNTFPLITFLNEFKVVYKSTLCTLMNVPYHFHITTMFIDKTNAKT